MKYLVGLLLFSTLLSCSDEGNPISIPRFSVDPLNASGLLLSALPSTHRLNSSSFPQNTSSKCRSAMANWKAKQTALASTLLQTNTPDKEKILLETLYAQTIFYDCHIRELAHNNGISSSNQSYNGETIPILTAQDVWESTPENHTQFLSWIDLPETRNIQGKMIDKDLDSNNVQTKIRIDLNIENGARKIKSLLISTNKENNEMIYSKADFKELLNQSGVKIVHLVSGRYYDSETRTLIVISAYVRAYIGTAIFTRRCYSTTNPSITFSSGCTATLQESYYNSQGRPLTEAEAGNAGLPTDIQNTNWHEGEGQIIETLNFYSGNERDFFEPTFIVGS